MVVLAAQRINAYDVRSSKEAIKLFWLIFPNES